MIITSQSRPTPPRVARAPLAPSADAFTPVAPEWKAPSLQEVTKAVGSARTTLPNGESATWSTFAAERHHPGTGNSYFQGSQADLLKLVESHWDERRPGTGRSDLSEVVAVPVPAQGFMTTTVGVTPETKLHARFDRRREHEEPYLRVSAHTPAEPAKFAQVILYSKATLAQNHENTSDCDWEVVSLVASPVENEPMSPVTMMRNMREKPGGTKVTYTADQLLDAIDFWSSHAKADG